MTTELRELLDTAADDATPVDLAHRALDAARRRRQQRFAVVGAVAAVTALVAGAVVLGPLQQSGDEPRPQDVASLPGELPGPSGLPELTAGAMDTASTAYVIDDRLVLVDATTGDAASWAGITELTGLDTGGMDAGALRPYQVRLSPDGTTALVAMRFESSQRLLGIRLAVLDVATAESSVEDLQLSDAYAESAWLEYNLMAWDPDGKTAYCVCHDGSLGVWSLTVGNAPIDTFYSQLTDSVPTQISAGADGLAVQLEPGGEWALLEDNGTVGTPLAAGDALAPSLRDSGRFVVTRDGTFGIKGADESGEGMAWQPLPAGPVSSVQALGDDFVLVSQPESALPGEPAPPSQLLAHVLTPNAAPQLLTTFPSGTTSTSFAAEVDTVQ